MKLASTIARYLLGLIFFVFGLNKFLHFIPDQPMPGMAGQFAGVLVASHYLMVVAVIEVAGGTLLLSGRYVPLALTLLGPIIVNILLFHVLMDPGDLPLALVVVVLWALTAWRVWPAFAGLFQQKVD